MKIPLTSTISIISNLVLLISVIVLILEVRQNQTGMLAQASYERTRMAIANDLALTNGARSLLAKIRTDAELDDEEEQELMSYYVQMMRYFENLHYLNDIGVLDDQIWEANKSGIELFCSHQLANPAYPVLGEEQEFKYRADFVQFWRSTCDFN
jgi:hypothetical protein